MKREEASKPIELSYLIAKEGKNTNNNENTKDYEKYLTFINNKETISNEKRQWIVKIILFILIANFSIGAWYFENIFRTGIHVIHEELKRGNLKFILASYMLVYSLIPIIFSLIIKKHDIYIFPTYITGVIFLGHCLCVIAMFLHKKYFIFLGLFISSLCINPLVILQKILVIEIFQQDKLGFFISIILSIEKMIKFLSFSRSDFNKNQIYDINISFIISSTLSFFSFLICIIYSQIMKNMKVSYILPKKKDVFKNIETMSVYFWWYLLICFLCSCIWNPFLDFLDKIKHIYFLKNVATDISSTVLLLSFLLYPLIGWVNDLYGYRLIILMMSLFMSLLSFMSLLLPIRSNVIFTILFSFGQSISFIILIILSLYISKNTLIVLGFYKSMEISGNIIMQSLVNIILNSKKKKSTDINLIIMLFIILNMFSLVLLAAFYRHDNFYNKGYINNCLFTLFNKKTKIIYQDIIFRSKEISLKLTKNFLGFIIVGLILTWILYIISIS